MADRSEISVNVCDGSFKTPAAADAIDKTNDHVIAAGSNFKRLILLVHLTGATATDTVTIKAGMGEPAFRRALGDLVFEAAGGAEEAYLGPIETARFIQADGAIHIDVAGSTIAGTLEAYALP